MISVQPMDGLGTGMAGRGVGPGSMPVAPGPGIASGPLRRTGRAGRPGPESPHVRPAAYDPIGRPRRELESLRKDPRSDQAPTTGQTAIRLHQSAIDGSTGPHWGWTLRGHPAPDPWLRVPTTDPKPESGQRPRQASGRGGRRPRRVSPRSSPDGGGGQHPRRRPARHGRGSPGGAGGESGSMTRMFRPLPATRAVSRRRPPGSTGCVADAVDRHSASSRTRSTSARG
jgi:hypothetical protein